MAVQPINTLKSWFETADKPTQNQFWDWMDSFFHKNEMIPQASITDLVNTLNSLVLQSVFDAFEQGQLVTMDANYTYVIPAGYLLEKIIPYYGGAGEMQISIVGMGQTDISEIPEIAAGWNRPVQLDIMAENNTDVFIDGIPAASKIVFLKRKIKMA
ncbi:MAG: hypothetical protein ACT4OJ_06255 [Bacteroidota bacterium]